MEISRKAGWDCLRISTGRANAVGPDFLAGMRAALEELSPYKPDAALFSPETRDRIPRAVVRLAGERGT
jgi:hypothetical protein